MSLLRFEDLSIEFGDTPILTSASLSIEPAERVCIIGRNGAGKSTLLKLLAGTIQPDRGEIQRSAGLVVSALAQNLPEESDQSVFDFVKGGLETVTSLITRYESLAATDLDDRGLRELNELQHRIDATGGWDVDQRVQVVMDELELPADKPLNALSGGWRRRVSLGRAIATRPDLLLMDEPTNHLDFQAVEWLEQQILRFQGSVIFITHDRVFLQKLATRIVEIDRGVLTSWNCDYQSYLVRREKALEVEARENERFDKKLAEEEAWIRQGIKARRTRNEGRARALAAMRRERAKRINRPKDARIEIEQAEQSGRKVVEAFNVSYGYNEQAIIESFSLKVMRGDRIGIVGNNGVGKSTLLRLLLGELEPRTGTIKTGTGIQLGYFDQLRRDLDLDKTVVDAVGDGRDFISIGGKDRHVMSYLQGFLFSAKRARSPVRSLSGGERSRVLLARMFARPSNMLVLDEPTNDLDVETLEVLEQQLVDYPGTLVVVSHDREFLDNVVTSILVFEQGGKIEEYLGGYSEWARRGRNLATGERAPVARPSETKEARRKAQKATKLSYRDQRELDALPAQIEDLEQEIGEQEQLINTPDFYAGEPDEVQRILLELENRRKTLDNMVERWAALEELQQSLRDG